MSSKKPGILGMGHTGAWWWPLRVSCTMLLWVHSVGSSTYSHLPFLWQLLRVLGTELDLMPSGHQTRLTGDKAAYMGPAGLTEYFPCAGTHLQSGVRCS